MFGGGDENTLPHQTGGIADALDLLPTGRDREVVEIGTAEALVMRQTLVDEFGIAVKWMETQSRNTHENALRSAEILRAHAVRRVILVGHGFDMRRSRAEFEAAGLQVVPAPTMLSDHTLEGHGDLIPNPRALARSYYALYELLANSVLRIGL